MRRVPELSVVIPAYNEESRILPTLESVRDYIDRRGVQVEVIVVDDGSLDGTSALVNRLAADWDELRLIRLADNRGKGYAVRSGMINARGRKVLFADADGATPIEEVEALEAALEDGADIAIGSRNVVRDGVKVNARIYRRLMGRIFHAFVASLTVQGIEDTQCGFKLFRAGVAQELFSRMRMCGFSFDVEVLLMAQRQGYTIAEIPVNWVHQPGSKVNLVTDSLRMVRDLFIIRGHSVRGHYVSPHVATLPIPEPAHGVLRSA